MHRIDHFPICFIVTLQLRGHALHLLKQFYFCCKIWPHLGSRCNLDLLQNHLFISRPHGYESACNTFYKSWKHQPNPPILFLGLVIKHWKFTNCQCLCGETELQSNRTGKTVTAVHRHTIKCRYFSALWNKTKWETVKQVWFEPFSAC